MSRLRQAPGSLPRSGALAHLALATAPTPERLDPSLRRVLASRLAAKAPGRHLGTIRLDGYSVLERDPAGSTGPFRWSPRNAKRLLGLAAARRLAEGRAASPLAAVRAELDGAIERAAAAHSRPGTLGAWLTEAPPGLLAAVIAEASGYTTELLGFLDAGSLADRLFLGRPDPVWAVPGAPWISLRGRRDAEVVLDAEQRTRALLATRGGRPGARSADDLALVALADALAQPAAPLPTRVVGLWPSCGTILSLEVSAETVRRGARLVVEAVDRRGRQGSQPLAA
jgi:hypothetical protein